MKKAELLERAVADIIGGLEDAKGDEESLWLRERSIEPAEDRGDETWEGILLNELRWVISLVLEESDEKLSRASLRYLESLRTSELPRPRVKDLGTLEIALSKVVGPPEPDSDLDLRDLEAREEAEERRMRQELEQSQWMEIEEADKRRTGEDIGDERLLL